MRTWRAFGRTRTLTRVTRRGPEPRGRAACPRAWPAHTASGISCPPRSDPRAAAAPPPCARSTGHGRRAPERGVDGEVGRRDVVELVPGDREGDGTPGRTRRLYAATTVAPPTRVASTKTFPPRSALTNAVVAISGSSRRRAPRSPGSPRRHPPAMPCRRSARTRGGPSRRSSSGRPRGRHRSAPVERRGRPEPPSGTRRPPGGRGRAPGASSDPADRRAPASGWYSIARWFATHTLRPRSYHTA